MITKLTKAQEMKIPVYLDKWLKYGLRTEAMDRDKSKAAVNFLYEEILKIEKPKYVIFLDSPMACQLAANLLKDTKFDEKISNSQLYSQLDSQLYSQLDSQLDSQLRSQLYSQLYSQLLTVFDYPFTQWWWTYIGGFYDYVLHEIFPEKKKDFKLYTTFLKHWPELHYYLSFKDIVFISDFPKEINRNSENRLHKDGGAALLYRDTYSLFRLNGINVSKELVEMPKDKITKDMIIKETNADVRREIIRKVGTERLSEVLEAKVLDTYKDYRLISFDIGDGRVRPFLEMVNPSLGIKHIEGVRSEIKTVKDAICYRNGLKNFQEPERLT